MVTFVKFVRPALQQMMGISPSKRTLSLRAKIEDDIQKKDGKRHYVRGIIEYRNGTLSVRTTGSQVSNILTSLSKANCLITLPEHIEVVRSGDEVEVELL
jgi:molybdopterin molybdotransferase